MASKPGIPDYRIKKPGKPTRPGDSIMKPTPVKPGNGIKKPLPVLPVKPDPERQKRPVKGMPVGTDAQKRAKQLKDMEAQLMKANAKKGNRAKVIKGQTMKAKKKGK